MITYPNIGLGNASLASGCIATTHWSVNYLSWGVLRRFYARCCPQPFWDSNTNFFNPLSKLMTKETKPWFRFCRILLFNQDRFRLVHRRFFFKLLCCRYMDNRYFYSIRTIILLWNKSMSKNLLVCIGWSLIAKRGEGGGGEDTLRICGWRCTTGLWLGYARQCSTAMYYACLTKLSDFYTFSQTKLLGNPSLHSGNGKYLYGPYMAGPSPDSALTSFKTFAQQVVS